ncbi:hypothetical protein ACH5RR_040587 [Cinchona calisaya]|uniref:Uncharacterized protein n=1 Tax=Cinchona calisaya TaxID=153742 RepID=A0ABD2XUR2_9GENT
MGSIPGMLESAPMYLFYSGAMFYPMFVAHQTAPGGPISPYLSGRMVHPSSVEHQSVPGGLMDPFLSGGMLYSPFVAHQAAPAVPMPLYLSGVMGNSSFVARQTVPGGPMPLPYSGSSVPMPIRPKAPTSNPALNYQTAASEHVSNRLRLLGTSHQSPMIIPIDVASSSNVGPITGVANRNAPATANVTQSGEVRSLGNANDLKKSKNCELTEIDEPLELHSLKLPDSPSAEKDRVGSQTSTNCWSPLRYPSVVLQVQMLDRALELQMEIHQSQSVTDSASQKNDQPRKRGNVPADDDDPG